MFTLLFIVVITRAWPSKGNIVLDKVSVKYNDNQDPVISNVSLNIPPGQKVTNIIFLKQGLLFKSIKNLRSVFVVVLAVENRL